MTSAMQKSEPSAAITVSLVSHGHGRMVADVLEDLACMPQVAHVVLTLNVPEPLPAVPSDLQGRLTVIEKSVPEGFAANHNAAFLLCETPFFCVLNPDIRLPENPFDPLADSLLSCEVGVIAPGVLNPDGRVEDSARYFPTFLQLLRKVLAKECGRVPLEGSEPQPVDWTAGMFLLFPASAFREIGGFDEAFFLYYEDVDICIRLWKSGRRVILHPGVFVVHSARRTSRRKLRYMAWHLSSMVRYFAKHAWRLPSRGNEKAS